MNVRVPVSLCAALCLLIGAWPVDARASEGAREVPFLGEGYRWEDRGLFTRIGLDLVALPASAAAWQPRDWAQALGVGATVGTLMFAGSPSPDLRLDRFIEQRLSSHVPEVWTPAMQVVLWGSVGVGGLGAWALGHALGDDHLAQGASLMIESVAVTQAFHLTLKLLIGREGPGQGSGEGRILGPLASFGLLPAGTPSGHAATLFAIASSGFAYFAPPAWLQAAGYGITGTLIAFHVLNRRHFISESLWGAALGVHVGTWVVRHRASTSARVAGTGQAAGRAGFNGWSFTPLAVPGGLGVGLSGQL